MSICSLLLATMVTHHRPFNSTNESSHIALNSKYLRMCYCTVKYVWILFIFMKKWKIFFYSINILLLKEHRESRGLIHIKMISRMSILAFIKKLQCRFWSFKLPSGFSTYCCICHPAIWLPGLSAAAFCLWGPCSLQQLPYSTWSYHCRPWIKQNPLNG